MKNSLKKTPIDINENCWYYEENDGIIVVQEIFENNKYQKTVQIKLPWSKLKNSVIRKYKSGVLSIDDLYINS